MTKEQIALLLGRPLTTLEDANFDTFLEIAMERLSTLTCISLLVQQGDRIFTTRDGYKTAYLDIFTAITKVEVDGKEIPSTKYSLRQWDKTYGTWFNSVVLDDDPKGKEIKVTGSWGTASIPGDLQLLISKLFDGVTKKDNGNVRSKKIEDFSISYTDESALDAFHKDNRGVINKYSLCDVIDVTSGKVKCLCLDRCGC